MRKKPIGTAVKEFPLIDFTLDKELLDSFEAALLLTIYEKGMLTVQQFEYCMKNLKNFKK